MRKTDIKKLSGILDKEYSDVYQEDFDFEGLAKTALNRTKTIANAAFVYNVPGNILLGLAYVQGLRDTATVIKKKGKDDGIKRK